VEVGAVPARQSPQHDELPLANYDQLPLGAVEHRIRSLEAEELETLLAYEHEHADRAPVTRVLDERLAQVRSGSELSPGGGPAAPERPAAAAGGSKVTPASSPEPMSPPPHGQPAQPAQPKGNRAR
jgi:hypothetical protein